MTFSNEMSGVMLGLMNLAIVFLIVSFDRKNKAPNVHKYGTIVVFVLSIILFIWVLCNKEFFHWRFDVATGAAVDHYSTYYECVIHGAVACILSIINIVLCLIRNKKRGDGV